MKKLASTLPNMILSLGSITIIAGAILGSVYAITKEPIAKQEAEKQVQAIREVAPEFDNNPSEDKWSITMPSGIECVVYPAYKNGILQGAAVETASNNGFAGHISIMAGFLKDGTVKNYQVLQQGETPGLGTKMETWFRDTTGSRSIIGKNPSQTPFYVTKDTEKNGAIDGITAATISSRAFLEAMRDAFEAYKQFEEKQQ